MTIAEYGKFMILRLKTYPVQIKIVLAILLLQFLTPGLWFLLGAVLPTIPFVAFGILCFLAATGILSLLGIIGIINGYKWGKVFAPLSLFWLLVTTFFFFVLETIRFFVTDYPDPILFTVFEMATLLSVLTFCILGLIWILGKYGESIPSG